jgi:hypothetical protein
MSAFTVWFKRPMMRFGVKLRPKRPLIPLALSLLLGIWITDRTLSPKASKDILKLRGKKAYYSGIVVK